MDKSLFENRYGRLSDAVVALENGKIVYRNDAAQRLFGDIAEGADGRDFFDSSLLNTDENGVSGFVKASGAKYEANAHREDGTVLITVLCGTGRQDFVRTAQDICSMLQDASSVFRMGIDGLSQYTRPEDNEKVGLYMSVLQHNFHRIYKLTNHLSDLYCGGRMNMELSCFNISEAYRNVINTTNYLACTDREHIVFECSEPTIMFSGDRERIEQMLLNLLSNSIKYTPADGTITVKLEKTAGGVRVTVSDTGCGMDRRALKDAFSLRRADRDTVDVAGGLGLGLPLVQEIARMHSGACVITDGKNGGTVVTVSLETYSGEMTVHQPQGEYTAGLSMFLTELSDILSAKQYVLKHLD